MSSDDRPVIIKPTMDATGVRVGAEEVKKVTRDMATDVVAAGRKAGEGLDDVGDGAKRGAAAVEAETRRMVGSLQRAEAAARAGGRGTADYFQTIAKQRGLNTDVLNPYIANLRAAEAAQLAATGSLGKMGVSAAQTAAALRGVPAQFTDIITSLQGGQAPLQVFLQQGGQLKDMFGGAGAAAQALGGYVLGLINPFTVLAALAGTVAVGFALGSKEAQAYTQALVLSGNAVGTTADKLADLASAIDATGPVTQSKAAEVLTQLASAGDVGAQNLERFARAAIELERAGGPAAEETAKAFSALAKEPLAASLKLTESTRFLTAATAEQIRVLESQGKTVEAARVAQEAYAATIEERVPQLVDRLGLLERVWIGIKDATKAAGDAVLDIGRADTLQQQIQGLNSAIDGYRRMQGSDGGGLLGRFFGGLETDAVAQRDVLQEQVRLSQRAAEAAGNRARQEQAAITFAKEGAKYLDQQARFAQEIARTRELGRAAGLDEEQIATRIRAIVKDTYGAKAGKADDAASREQERRLEAQTRLVAELSGVTASYAQDLKSLDAARQQGVLTEERYGELVRELVQRQPIVRQNAKDLAEAATAQARAVKSAEEAYSRYLAGLDDNLATGAKTLQQLRLEIVELNAGKKVRLELELLERERLAVTYDQLAAQAVLDGEEQARYQRLAEQVREEIRLRRALAASTASAEVRDANAKAAQEAAREWERSADQVGQSLSDAIFQGGKNAGELLRDYFRTLVLKPIIETAVRPISLAISGALGFTGAAASAAGANGGGGVGQIGQVAGLLGGAAGSIFNAGVQAAMAGNLGGALTASGNLIAGGQVGTGLSFGAGALGAYAGGLGIGVLAGRTISNGYAISGSGNGVVNAGAIAGAIIGGPIGAAIGGAIGGAANALFGRKLKDTGIEGNFAAGDFSGSQFQFYKGGFLRSDKTRYSALDADLEAVLDAGGQAAFAQAKAYAEILGLPADALAGYTKSVKLSLQGLSEEQAQAAVAQAVVDFQEGLLGRFAAQLAPLARTGETLSQVAERVTALQIFTRGINELGGVFARVGGLSIDAREQLIQLAGGVESFSQQALGFVQQYYSREEIAGLKAREIQTVLAAAGITGDVNSRDQFRGIVESTDISTTAGRERLAQLLAIAGDFAQVADFLAETGGTLSGAAAFAPATGQLADLFSQPQEAQVNAINGVSAEVRGVNESIGKLIELAQQAIVGVWERNAYEVGIP
jgi:phage-related minor tail protein